MSPNVARFVRNLCVDPSLSEAFDHDREACLLDAELTDEERDYVRDGHLERELAAAGPVRGPAPGGPAPGGMAFLVAGSAT